MRHNYDVLKSLYVGRNLPAGVEQIVLLAS